MREAEKVALWARVELTRYGQEQLGVREWGLLHSYGKLMTGEPFGGLYVSGVPCEMGKCFVDALVRGETIKVHLMHRHRSGHYEASSLRLHGGRLVMVFNDREELA